MSTIRFRYQTTGIGGTMKGLLLSLLIVSLFLSLVITPLASAAVPTGSIAACTGCHSANPLTNTAPLEGASRNNPEGYIIGSHTYHVNTQALLCSDCHVVPGNTAYGHRNKKINMASSMKNGVVYNIAVGNAVPQSNQLSTVGMGTCSGGSAPCHSSASPVWGTVSNCQSCHGYPPDTTPVGNPNDKHQGTAVNHGNFTNVTSSKTFVLKHGGCQICHGNQSSDGTITGSHSPHANYTTLAKQHGTGKINMNGPVGVGVGYNRSNGGCNAACHANDLQHQMATTSLTISYANYGTAGGPNCIASTCHAIAQGSRSAIVGEFNQAWGHKKSTRTAVTNSDCIVCHLEGTFAGQTTSGYHMNGVIDLRDPDGAGETPITNNSGGVFTFTKYAVSYAAGSRTTTLGNSIAEVVTVKFCMKCHDSNGATNPTARTRNATNTATTGTQYMPFEGVSTGYSVINGAASANGVIDVATQFASYNSSRHPVGAPNSRAYPYSTRLVAPYNNIGTARDGNVQTGGGTGTRTKANSVIMVCDDCHTVTTAPGAVPALLDRTITAHGTAQVENVRGTFMVTSPTLCLSCHGTAGTTANQTTSQIDTNTTSGGDHNPGSAFTTGTTRVASFMTQCQYCHFSAITKPARPIRAQDVHGFNGMQTTGAGWASGTVTGMRPVAFMRNVANWASASPRPAVVLSSAAPASQIAVAAGQSTCAGAGDLSNASCSGQTGKHLNYSPGGSY